jgi:dsRNA-specific ribonuclease
MFEAIRLRKEVTITEMNIMDKLTENDVQCIRKTIGYTFDNTALLKQCFLSAAAGTGCDPDGLVLRMIGNEALNLAVISFLTETYGGTDIGRTEETNGGTYVRATEIMNEGADGEIARKTNHSEDERFYRLKHPEYRSGKFRDGDCSVIIGEMRRSGHLTRCIRSLGLSGYLNAGRDKPEAGPTASHDPDEDLLKAILGAVLLDSGWNLSAACCAAGVLIDIEAFFFGKDTDGERYIGIIREWSLSKGYGLPVYSYSYSANGDCECELSFPDNKELHFGGTARSAASGRRLAARNAYRQLTDSGMIVNRLRAIAGPPERDRAPEQIKMLADAGMIAEPVISLTEGLDCYGHRKWNCTVSGSDCDRFFTVSGTESKDDVVRECAFEYLSFIMGEFELNDD